MELPFIILYYLHTLIFFPQSPIQSVTFRHIHSISSFLEFLPVLGLIEKMNNAFSEASLALFFRSIHLERGLKWQKVQLVWHVTSDSNLSLEDFNTLKKYCHLDVPNFQLYSKSKQRLEICNTSTRPTMHEISQID